MSILYILTPLARLSLLYSISKKLQFASNEGLLVLQLKRNYLSTNLMNLQCIDWNYELLYIWKYETTDFIE